MSKNAKKLINAPISFKDWSEVIREVRSKPGKSNIELSVANFFASAELVKNSKIHRKKGLLNITTNTKSLSEK